MDEVVYSDLVLLVMDATDPKFQQKMQITENILTSLFKKRELSPPVLYVLNKTDLPESLFTVRTFPKEKEHVSLSAKTGLGKEQLFEKIEEILSQAKKSCTFFFPHEEGGRLSFLYKTANVEDVQYETEGIRVVAICDEKTRGSLAPFLITE